jgi:hypothetical protein
MLSILSAMFQPKLTYSMSNIGASSGNAGQPAAMPQQQRQLLIPPEHLPGQTPFVFGTRTARARTSSSPAPTTRLL